MEKTGFFFFGSDFGNPEAMRIEKVVGFFFFPPREELVGFWRRIKTCVLRPELTCLYFSLHDSNTVKPA